MAILTNYEGSGDDYENTGTTAGDAGQSFQVPSQSSVTSVSIQGSQGVTPTGTFKLELLSGSYAGTVIATTGTLTTSSALTAYSEPAGAWNELTLSSPVVLSASTTYWIKLTVISGSTNDEIRWTTDTTSPSYFGGAFHRAGVENTAKDRNFRVNGTVVSGPANLKTYNTNVKANIKTINTNVIANVKSLNTNV